MAEESPLSALNAQLMNHGWAKRPLNLDALDDRSRIDVVTTMFEMLGAHVVSHSEREIEFPRADGV